MTEDEIYFKRLELGPMVNFVYVVGDLKTRKVAVVDPAWEVETILKVVQADQVEISDIFLTHGHPDHANGVEALAQATGASIWLHELERPWEGTWDQRAGKVRDGEVRKVGNLEFEFLHTPGHTEGSVCIRVEGRLLTGDTLFVGACGRTDLPGGDSAKLYASLQRLAKLPESLEVLPGHGYGPASSSTIGQEKELNPFMTCSLKDRFLKMLGS